MTIEEQIKKILKERGFTYRELCRKVEMTESGLRISLANNSIKVDTLQKIANALGVDINTFFATTIIKSIKDEFYEKTSIIDSLSRYSEDYIYRPIIDVGIIYEDILRSYIFPSLLEETENLFLNLSSKEKEFFHLKYGLSLPLKKSFYEMFITHLISGKMKHFEFRDETLEQLNRISENAKANFRNAIKENSLICNLQKYKLIKPESIDFTIEYFLKEMALLYGNKSDESIVEGNN